MVQKIPQPVGPVYIYEYLFDAPNRILRAAPVPKSMAEVHFSQIWSIVFDSLDSSARTIRFSNRTLRLKQNCAILCSEFRLFKIHPIVILLIEVNDDDDIFDAVMIVFNSNSEDDSDNNEDGDEELLAQEIVAVPHIGGGSLTGRGGNVERQRVIYSHLLYKEFLGPNPVYTSAYFNLFLSYQLLFLLH